jgi:hypothetical protein
MITASHTIPLNYRGVALAAPFSTSYQRYSLETAHWWIATVLRGSLEDAGLETSDIDGFSFRARPWGSLSTSVSPCDGLTMCLWGGPVPASRSSGPLARYRQAMRGSWHALRRTRATSTASDSSSPASLGSRWMQHSHTVPEAPMRASRCSPNAASGAAFPFPTSVEALWKQEGAKSFVPERKPRTRSWLLTQPRQFGDRHWQRVAYCLGLNCASRALAWRPGSEACLRELDTK